VEAVRHRDAAVAGLMWHPEREEPFAGVDIAVFRDFFGGLS
jgi:putative glutamine amidotransferase